MSRFKKAVTDYREFERRRKSRAAPVKPGWTRESLLAAQGYKVAKKKKHKRRRKKRR